MSKDAGNLFCGGTFSEAGGVPAANVAQCNKFQQPRTTNDIYVTTNGSDTADGLTWATAKRTIQAAVDIAGVGKTVWVSNGVYDTGGGLVRQEDPTRVCMTYGITLRSVNGAARTTIVGGSGMRVVYMETNNTLIGFTITGASKCRNAGGIHGEEGTVWEAAMFAGQRKLTGLIAIVDYNRVQLSGTVPGTLDLEPLADKWRAFQWLVFECDGHELASVVPLA